MFFKRIFLKLFLDWAGPDLSGQVNSGAALHCSSRTMEESGTMKEKKLTWQRWRCWWLTVASLSWLPVVSDDGSSSFFVSAWLPLSVSVASLFLLMFLLVVERG